MKQKKTISGALAKILTAVFWVSVCMVDSDTWVPTVVCGVSLMYLGIYTYVNAKFGEGETCKG